MESAQHVLPVLTQKITLQQNLQIFYLAYYGDIFEAEINLLFVC